MSGNDGYERLLEAVRAAAEVARVGDSPDMEGVKGLVGAMGQTFTTTVFAFQQVSQLKSNMDFLAAMAQKYREPWMNTVAAELFRRPINTLRTRYALNGTADLYEQAAPLAAGLTPEQLTTLARRLIEHHGFLARRIRDLLPFYELACAFEGHKVVTAAEKRARGNP